MIDFSDAKTLVNSYEGANTKLKVEYEGETYMLKFRQKLEQNPNNPLQASYSSAPISEYLGSHIFQLAGIPVQETLVGTYRGNPVVACKDFIRNRPDSDSIELVEFKKLEISFLGGSSAGGRTPLYDNLISIFNSHDSLAGIRSVAEERYWQTFVVDALIGNFDRHGGNWGYAARR